MIASAKRRATYADVLAAPAHTIAEVLFGVLYTLPRPARRHTRTASRLGITLGAPFDLGGPHGPGGWIILDEPELHFGPEDEEDIVVPDLAGWRRDRMSEVGDGAFFTVAPDWVCEVLSPSTEATDRTEKMRIYAREGVSFCWLIDPIQKTLEVFRLRSRGKAHAKAKKKPLAQREWGLLGVWRDDARVRAEPFDAVEISLAMLWS